MNAIEFVKQNGIEKAKQIVDLLPMSTLINIDGIGVSISDLKQIVDAFELVERSGGLVACRNTINTMDSISSDKNGLIYKPFAEAVSLVEQCK